MLLIISLFFKNSEQNLILEYFIWMDKKYGLTTKTSPEGYLHSQPQIPTFKKQNVVLKIQTGKGQQNYNAKTFPAKFSINICNQRNQLGSGYYNRSPVKSIPGSQQLIQFNKKQYQNLKTERAQTKFDLQQCEKQLKIIYEDKKKCDRLVMQLQETCQQYQRQNQEYINCLDQKNLKIQQLRQNLMIKDKKQAEMRQSLIIKEVQIRQLKQKIKAYQNQNNKLKQMFNSKQKQNKNDVQKLRLQLVDLESVIKEKEETIKKISNFNNQIAKKVLNQQSQISKSQVKQMEKWLKLMSTKYQNNANQKSLKQGQVIRHNQAIIAGLMNKSEDMSTKIIDLQKLVNYLDIELKKVYMENEGLMKANQQLQRVINELDQSLKQKQVFQSNQQMLFRQTLNSAFNQQEGGIMYEGTVKIKMQNLLVEKDKRINLLQSQLLDTKKENTLLRSKLYQLDCEQQINLSSRATDQFSLKKARSVGNFKGQKPVFKIRNSGFDSPIQNSQQIFKVMTQCNNLTQTLDNFIETCKTQRTAPDEIRRSRFSQVQYSTQPEGQNVQKIKQLMRLQKQTLTALQMNMRNTNNNMEQSKWNCIREENNYKINKERNFIFPNHTDPISQRIQKTHHIFKRNQRSQKSSYFNQDIRLL